MKICVRLSNIEKKYTTDIVKIYQFIDSFVKHSISISTLNGFLNWIYRGFYGNYDISFDRAKAGFLVLINLSRTHSCALFPFQVCQMDLLPYDATSSVLKKLLYFFVSFM